MFRAELQINQGIYLLFQHQNNYFEIFLKSQILIYENSPLVDQSAHVSGLSRKKVSGILRFTL